MRPWFAIATVLIVAAAASCDTDGSGQSSGTAQPAASSCPFDSDTGPSIIVTQAVQTDTNSVQLIAERSTAVRVAAVSGEISGGDDYTGGLRVFVDGVELPGGEIAPVAEPITAPATVDRDDPTHTLDFELPAPTGIGSSSDVEMCVTLRRQGQDIGEASVAGLNFAAAENPRLFFTRVNYDGLGLADIGDIEAGVGDAFVAAIYPFDDSDADLYRESPAPTLVNSSDTGTPQFVDQGTDVNNLLADLSAARQLIVVDGIGATADTFLYGWLPGNPISGNGWAPVGGRNAFGNTDPIRSQRTFAHELGHNFGLQHNSRSLDPDTGWDTGSRLDANPAGNNTTGSVRVSTLNDIMRGGQLTNSAWVDPTTYDFVLDHPDVGVTAAPDADRETTERVAVVTGMLTPDGTAVERLFPVQRLPWPSEPSTPLGDEEYQVVIDAGGETLTGTFTGQIAAAEDEADEDGESEMFGFFEVMVPVDPDVEIDRLRIATVDGEPLIEVEASAPPEATFTRPDDGGRLDGTVSWEVFDDDTSDDEIVLQLVFSPDGGESWVPVAVNLPGTARRFSYDPGLLPPTDGDGVLRLIVSDGLNSVFTDVAGLS